MIGWTTPAGPTSEWLRFGECPFFQFDVGMQTHLRGVHEFMSEPHRDNLATLNIPMCEDYAPNATESMNLMIFIPTPGSLYRLVQNAYDRVFLLFQCRDRDTLGPEDWDALDRATAILRAVLVFQLRWYAHKSAEPHLKTCAAVFPEAWEKLIHSCAHGQRFVHVDALIDQIAETTITRHLATTRTGEGKIREFQNRIESQVCFPSPRKNFCDNWPGFASMSATHYSDQDE